MTAFRDIEASETRAPPKTVVLDPLCFADTWPRRPKAAVCVGLRTISEAEKTTARAEAERLADELHDQRDANWLDAFNDALIRELVACAICSPNNINQPSEILPMAEVEVRIALTSKGARRIFEDYLRLEVETSPLYPEATDEDIEALVEALGDVDLGGFPAVQRAAIRRYLRFALDAINETREALGH